MKNKQNKTRKKKKDTEKKYKTAPKKEKKKSVSQRHLRKMWVDY